MDGHSSGMCVATHLARPTRAAAWKQGPDLRPRRPYSVLLPVGFAVPPPLPACAVRSYRTLSPSPRENPRQTALCGTFPKVTLAGRYPAPCLHGARTFLQRNNALRRSSAGGHPADWRSHMYITLRRPSSLPSDIIASFNGAGRSSAVAAQNPRSADISDHAWLIAASRWLAISIASDGIPAATCRSGWFSLTICRYSDFST